MCLSWGTPSATFLGTFSWVYPARWIQRRICLPWTSGENLVEMEKDDGVVDCPVDKGKGAMGIDRDEDPISGGRVMGKRASLFDDVVLVDVEDESTDMSPPGTLCGADVSASVKVMCDGVAEDSSRVHARPKKLVPARRLGLMNREEVRKSQQVVYSSSSEDEYEVHPETGERRRRVGYLFKTTPRPLLQNLLTDDDQWKLDGCSFPRRAERAERVTGLVCFC